jgi:hypothetical protein
LETEIRQSGRVYKNLLLSFFFFFFLISHHNLRFLGIRSIGIPTYIKLTYYEMATLAGKPIKGNGLGLMSKSDGNM